MSSLSDESFDSYAGDYEGHLAQGLVHAVRNLSEHLGEALGVEPVFTGEPSDTALLNDASKSHRLFGPPLTSVDEAITAVVAWLRAGHHTLGKPTKFEARDGKF